MGFVDESVKIVYRGAETSVQCIGRASCLDYSRLSAPLCSLWHRVGNHFSRGDNRFSGSLSIAVFLLQPDLSVAGNLPRSWPCV